MNRRITRREFASFALLALPLGGCVGAARTTARPAPGAGSRIAGVQVGVVSGSFGALPADQLIPALQRVGLSSVELTAAHAEALAGAPAAPPRSTGLAAPPVLNADGLQPRCAGLSLVVPYSTTAVETFPVQPAPTPAEAEATRDWQARLDAWRAAVTADTWRVVRRRFDDAGIAIPVVWHGLGFIGPAPSDDVIDYAFRMARGLGARTLAGSSKLGIAPRIAAAARHHGVPFAGHTQDNIHNPEQFATPEAYARLLALDPLMRICLDVGYFTAAGFDAVPFIREHHARIADIHLKDRKRSRPLGGDVTHNLLNNWPWGQGDSPIREVLRLVRDERYDIPVQIEFDHGCRTLSDPETEIARSLRYCRDALT